MRIQAVLACAVVGVVGFGARRAMAVDQFWTNPAGGSFHLAINWSGGVPGAGDNAVFSLGSPAPYAVALSSDVSNNQLRVGNDQVQLTFAGATNYALTSASVGTPSIIVGDLPGDVGQLTLVNATLSAAGQVVIGSDGDGTVAIPALSHLSAGQAYVGFVGKGLLDVQVGGRFDSSAASIGTNVGAEGTANISGVGSSWVNGGDLFVGDFGVGTLNVTNSGSVQTGGLYSGFVGVGRIVVDGGGALVSNSYLRIGDLGTGDFQITNGSASCVSAAIGGGGGIGTASVQGGASSWGISGPLVVAESGSGVLTIGGGGQVSANSVTISRDDGGAGHVVVVDVGSRLTVSGVMRVGLDGYGTLDVLDGAVVNSGGGVIGKTGGTLVAPNLANIAGTGAKWNMGNNPLVVADEGVGQLEISRGASVINGVAIVARNDGSSGAIALADVGTSWSSSGLVNIGLGGDGTLRISGGAQSSGTVATIGGDASTGAAGTGLVTISGSNSSWTLSGQLIVGGGGGGNLQMDGGGRMSSGSAIIGDGAVSYAIVDMSGTGTVWNNPGAVLVKAGTVALSGGAKINSGEVQVGTSGAGSVSVSEAGSMWVSGGAGIQIGAGGVGFMVIDSGGVVQSPGGWVGVGAGAGGDVDVNGSGSRWEIGDLTLGMLGADGALTIEAGGFVSSADSVVGDSAAGGSGKVVVKGAGSKWTSGPMLVGLGAAGNVEVSDGGRVDASNLGVVGAFGSVVVMDIGSKLVAGGNVEVGTDGSATMNVSGGGQVISDSGSVGRNAASSGVVTVSGAGSKWDMGSGDFSLGINGSGSLSLSSGAVASAGRGFVGSGISGAGVASVSGAGSQLVLVHSLYIGGDLAGPMGSGLVSVASGGVLSAANLVKVWVSGALDVENGNVTTALVDLQGGQLIGTGAISSAVSSTNGRIATDASMTLSGALSIVAGSNLTKQGSGTLTISGPQNHGAGATLHAAGGTIRLNSDAGVAASAGSAAVANLIVHVSGSSVMLGTDQELLGVNVDFANPGNQSFDLASPAGAGLFRSVRVYAADLNGAKSSLYAAMRNASLNPSDGILDSGLAAHANSKLGIAKLIDAHGDPYVLMRPTRVGDLNLDGMVTIADFIDLAAHFNQSGMWQEGDLNYDGTVTIADFIDLASNFNQSYSGELFAISGEDEKTLAAFASAHASEVPEPGLIIWGIAAGLLAYSRRRR